MCVLEQHGHILVDYCSQWPMESDDIYFFSKTVIMKLL